MNKKTEIRLKLYTKYLLSRNSKKFDKYKNAKQRIVIGLAADYGNLGDVAITYATTSFMKEKFPEAEIIDFPISKTFSEMKALKSVIKDHDIITIVGGGNMGDLYDDIEYCRQFIIEQFPNNQIISFPQTIDFSNTKYGNKAKEKLIDTYDSHDNLVVSAREKNSYSDLNMTLESAKVVLAPDIVLSLNESDNAFERRGITICFRSDEEQAIDDNEKIRLKNEVQNKYNVVFEDTHINKDNMSLEERTYELNKKWDTFKKSKLVITDRLHGMIFAAITGTPCIAFDNSNNKVSGVYNLWLRDLPYIQMASTTEKMLEDINEVFSENTEYTFNNNSYLKTFNKLLEF